MESRLDELGVLLSTDGRLMTDWLIYDAVGPIDVPCNHSKFAHDFLSSPWVYSSRIALLGANLWYLCSPPLRDLSGTYLEDIMGYQ